MNSARILTGLSLAALAGILWNGCASAPRAVGPRDFAPANEEARRRSLDAWKEALRRADSLPSSRLLYDLKYSKGAIRSSGTLAVVARRNGEVTATATGPFGTPMGDYRDGAFHIKNEQPFRLDPRLFHGMLAGVWKGGAPEVVGADGGESLLRWETSEGLVIEGVLDIAAARLTSLHAGGPQGELSIAFPGPFEPWPTVIEIVSEKTGQALRLKRDLVEPIQ
ncbi:MAG TPA: hypothetical protein VJA66_05790 [Thermoanaerobaculia bacterium]